MRTIQFYCILAGMMILTDFCKKTSPLIGFNGIRYLADNVWMTDRFKALERREGKWLIMQMHFSFPVERFK